MFFRLWENPSIVAKIRAEADAVLGSGPDARKMEYDMIKDLPYLNAVFNETARVSACVVCRSCCPSDTPLLSQLHPAVPKNFKTVVNDDVIVGCLSSSSVVPQLTRPLPQRPYAQPGVESILADMPPLEKPLPDVVVKAGEVVIFSDYVMSRLTEIWGEDAEEFKPERFLTTREDGSTTLRRYSEYHFHS